MKKMNALLAALALVTAVVTPMTSSAISATPDSESRMTLSRTYDSHYTLHIPDASPTLNDESVNVGFGVTGYLEYNEKLTVTVSSHNDWQLKDSNTENEEGVAYKMKVGERVITSENNAVMSITSDDNNTEVDTTLTFCDFEKPTYAGTYSDTLTFEVRPGGIEEEETTVETTPEEATPEETTPEV